MDRAISLFKQCYVEACLLELRALKPGNVGHHSDGHGMTVNQFQESAIASSGPLFEASGGIGKRILSAIQATREAVGDNTNLGIVILVAPIAEALCVHGYDENLQKNTQLQLKSLSVEDAKHAYRAINIAMPGGMGQVEQEDISDEPTVTLLKAMEMSADRDQIAEQYSNGYKDIFEHNLPIYWEYLDKWNSPEWAATALFLSQWQRQQDSLIIRKKGLLKAREINDMIAPLANQVLASKDPVEYKSSLLSLDSELKCIGINPGTTADLTVATLFVAMLESASIRDELSE